MAEPHYVVLVGDVGTGKSTLVEKISGVTGIASDAKGGYEPCFNNVFLV